MRKIKSCFKSCIIFCAVVFIIFLFVKYCIVGYRTIKFDQIAVAETEDNIEHEEFIASYRIYGFKQAIEEYDSYHNIPFCNNEEVFSELDKYDSNYRLIISYGKEISKITYFDDGNPIDPSVEYKNQEIENKIYIYKTDYNGFLVDYVNY